VEKSILAPKERRWSSPGKFRNSCLFDGCHSTCRVYPVDLLSGVVLYASVCSGSRLRRVVGC
jgi:hypothetical protein